MSEPIEITLNRYKLCIYRAEDNDGIYVVVRGAGKIAVIPDGTKNAVLLKRVRNEQLG